LIKVERPKGSQPKKLVRAALQELRDNRLKLDAKAARATLSVPAAAAQHAPAAAGTAPKRVKRTAAQKKAENLSFSAYSDVPEVRQKLNEIFARKCAFCESILLGTQSGDIEHYRPKGAVVRPKSVSNATPERPHAGYFWLAGRWSNLLLACADCNRPRTQLDMDRRERVIGKANFFPLSDEDKRAHEPGALSAEEPLLLDPCREDPEPHLSFREDGVVEAATLPDGTRSAKGVATIHYCGLSRWELLQMRTRHKRHVMAAIRHTVSALEARRDPGADLDDLLTLLDAREGAYVAFTRMLVRKHMAPYLETLGLPP